MAHPDHPCGYAQTLAVSQLAEVEVKLRRLVQTGCRGGVAAECRVLETLADRDHGHCLSAAQAAAEDAVTK